MGIIEMQKLREKFLSNSILRFVVVGGCSTLLDYIIYMTISKRMTVTLSKGISMAVASVFSYVMNKSFTFGNKDRTDIGYLVRFYLVFAANFATNLGINKMVYERTGQKTLAFILATLCGMTVNYLGQRFFVFKKEGQKREDRA